MQLLFAWRVKHEVAGLLTLRFRPDKSALVGSKETDDICLLWPIIHLMACIFLVVVPVVVKPLETVYGIFFVVGILILYVTTSGKNPSNHGAAFRGKFISFYKFDQLTSKSSTNGKINCSLPLRLNWVLLCRCNQPKPGDPLECGALLSSFRSWWLIYFRLIHYWQLYWMFRLIFVVLLLELTCRVRLNRNWLNLD